ncbi:hypothetical protein [uncultured Senegalimassilia sp.]|uniref:hypothetical protein n=1 Tax=uncultured Senegalimassilia sp. TaxID=1714350 RepID=UPI0025DC30E2|nr:hypothetical protein [uncultured Senegalimassilia sp.]
MANLKPKGRSSKRYGASSRPHLPQAQKRERVKTRSLSKTIGYPMIDKDPRMMR